MIKLNINGKSAHYDILSFRYKRLRGMATIERKLSAKGLKRLSDSGNNGYWEVYFNGYQPNISITCCLSIPDEIEVTVHKLVRRPNGNI